MRIVSPTFQTIFLFSRVEPNKKHKQRRHESLSSNVNWAKGKIVYWLIGLLDSVSLPCQFGFYWLGMSNENILLFIRLSNTWNSTLNFKFTVELHANIKYLSPRLWLNDDDGIKNMCICCFAHRKTLWIDDIFTSKRNPCLRHKIVQLIGILYSYVTKQHDNANIPRENLIKIRQI